MEHVFIKLLNMSIAAGWLILAVILLRILLKKAPRRLSCILWGIVAVRLICPISLESSVSLIPSAETINPAALTQTQEPFMGSGIQAFHNTVNPMFGDAAGASAAVSDVNFLQTGIRFAGIFWALGMSFLLLYAFVSFLRLHMRLREAVPLRDAGKNVWLCDAVNTPFILGILRPRIYLPSGLEQTEVQYVLAHERAHLKRKDHWWKLLAYLLLAVYWFHPLMWAAYVLFSRDIELACDERVVGSMDNSEKKAYSHALVSCSVEKRMILVCPLAFGEIGVRARVKAVLNYRKPAFWVIFAAVLACIMVAVCFLTNPRRDVYQVKIVIPAGSGQNEIAYSEEEISPLGNQIVLSAGEGLGDTQVVLFPMEWEEERTYEPVYMPPGMPVKMDAEKGAWFRIGIYADNPTDEDKVVYVRAEGVDIRIADQAQWAVIPMVMVNDKYYYDTNQESTKTDRSLNMDGEITSSVKGTEKPAKNNQSNFGTGYAYQFGENDTIEIRIDGKWMIFENRSGDGSLIRYGDHWYNVGDLSETTLEWLAWYNSLSEEEQLSLSYVPWDLQRVEKPENGTEDVGETPEEADNALKKAISNAIFKENESSYLSSYNIPCCDFLLLGTETSGEAPGEDETQTITCYGWALYQEYMISENGIEDMGGSHIPVALTFEQFGDIYILKEYWKPRDGSYFEADIRSRFKPEMAKDAMDSQKFILGQIQNCYKKVIEATELDTGRVVERLLDAICGSPAASSNSRDYVQEHSLEYRELLCYGEYTLRYCLNRFQKGQETGLEGKIMALVCEELLQTKGVIPEDADTASTGQAWYDTLYAHGSSRVEPYLE